MLQATDALLLPFHQDERLAADHIVLPDGLNVGLIEPQLPDAGQWQRLVALYDALAVRVSEQVRLSASTSVVTGDCLATIGTLAGLQRAGLDPSLVWFDAHGDVHTLTSSTSGYLGGMALRMALGADAERLGGPLGLRPLAESRAVLVGARDLDPAESTFLEGSDVQQVSADAIGPEHVPDGLILVHIDVDVIDASEVPGLRFPVRGGPTTQAVLAAIKRLAASRQVVALDIAAPWHPPNAAAETSARQRLLASLIATLD